MAKKKLKKQLEDHVAIRLIKRLPKEQQAVIGRIIWWDMFAGRDVKDRTTLFDHWLAVQGDHFNEPPDHVLAKTLVDVFGYDPMLAPKRVAFGNTLKVGYQCGGTRGRGV